MQFVGLYCILQCSVQRKHKIYANNHIYQTQRYKSVLTNSTNTPVSMRAVSPDISRLISSLKFHCRVRRNRYRDKSIQSTPPNSKFFKLILILSSYICLSLKTTSSLRDFRQHSVRVSPTKLQDPAISSAVTLCA